MTREIIVECSCQLRENERLAKVNCDRADLRQGLNESLPQFSAILGSDVVASIAKKPPSYLPGFQYVRPRLNQGNNTIILGDCAHAHKL